MDSYVLGFCFEQRHGHVVLIRKNKPDWQRDHLNGVGGKIEAGETPLQAMIREWYEETGEGREQWEQYITLNFPNVTVHCFRAFCGLSMANTVTDEAIIRGSVPSLLARQLLFGYPTIKNLPWLIAFALSGETGVITQP